MFTGSSTTPGFNSDAAILAGENGSIYLFGLDTYGYPLCQRRFLQPAVGQPCSRVERLSGRT